MKKIRRWIILLPAALMVLLSCCSNGLPPGPNHIKDGKEYGKIPGSFRHRWWNYYQRGLSFTEGEFYQEAIADLHAAIHHKRKDKRMARTYGRHFITDYFPHRELGIIYYKIGRTKEAIQELENSLQDCPSSKAKFYLNKARKAWVTQNNLDLLPPQLHLSFPSSDSYLTNKLSVTIKGRAEDDQFISTLNINDTPIFIELAADNISFSHTVPLKRGLNKIIITTIDLANKAAEKSLNIMVDRMGPIINLSLSSLEQEHHEGWIVIQGVIFDESGVDKMNINDQPIDIVKGKMVEFRHKLKFPQGLNEASFLATDMAGNETLGHIKLSSGTEIGMSYKIDSIDGQTTEINSKVGKKDLIQIASLDNDNLIQLASDDNNRQIETRASEESDGTLSDPILLLEPLPCVTVADQICLHGKIHYKMDISAINIFVNNKLVSRSAYTPSLLEKMKNMFTLSQEKILLFAENIGLNSGKNKIVVRVTNKKGISKKATYSIIQKKEAILGTEYRLCLSILPAEDVSEPEQLSSSINRYTFLKLKAAFVRQNRFQVLERENLAAILAELDVTAHDLINQEKAIVRLKKLLNAEIFLVNFIKWEKDALELNGTMIDTETSKLLCSEDAYLKGNMDNIIEKTAEILAMKISNKFPLCKGKVLKINGLTIHVDINKQIGNHTKLIVYRKEGWDTTFLSEARVESVYDNYSVAALLGGKKANEVKAGNLVITK